MNVTNVRIVLMYVISHVSQQVHVSMTNSHITSFVWMNRVICNLKIQPYWTSCDQKSYQVNKNVTNKVSLKINISEFKKYI